MKASLVGAAALLAASGAFVPRLDARAAAGFADREVIPATTAKWVARGFSLRRAMADMKWMEILQHTGDRLYHRDKGRELFRLASEATDLDPRFTFVHMFSGGMLMWNCSNSRDAIALLKKGIEDNPKEDRLKLYLAAFTYSKLGDLRSEVGTLERLATTPGVPPMIWRILANVYSRQGRTDRAVRMWQFIAVNSPEAEDRAWAKEKLLKGGHPLEP